MWTRLLSLLGGGWFKATEPGPHARSPVLPGSPSCFLPSPAAFKSTEPGPHARTPVLPGSSGCFLPSPADLGTPSPPLASPISATGTLSLVVSNFLGEDVTDSPRTNPSPTVRTCCPTKVGAPEEDLNCVAPPPLTLTPSTLLLGSVGFTELGGISSSLASFLSPTTYAGDTATLHCLYLALPVPTPCLTF